MFGDHLAANFHRVERVELSGGELELRADRFDHPAFARRTEDVDLADRLVAHPLLHGDHQRPADLGQHAAIRLRLGVAVRDDARCG